MPYVEWSVVALETPPASKWNILGENDSFFNSEIISLGEDITTLSDDIDGQLSTINSDISSLESAVNSDFVKLAGRSGGQTVYGGTGSGDDLILNSTSHATKGHVAINSTGGNVGIGTVPGNYALDFVGSKIRMRETIAGGIDGSVEMLMMQESNLNFHTLKFDGLSTENYIHYGGYGSSGQSYASPTKHMWYVVGSVGSIPSFGRPFMSLTDTGLRVGDHNNAETEFHLAGAMSFDETGTPPNVSSNEARLYLRNDKIVFMYTDGTTRYKYLDLTGTGTSWTYSASAP